MIKPTLILTVALMSSNAFAYCGPNDDVFDCIEQSERERRQEQRQQAFEAEIERRQYQAERDQERMQNELDMRQQEYDLYRQRDDTDAADLIRKWQ